MPDFSPQSGGEYYGQAVNSGLSNMLNMFGQQYGSYGGAQVPYGEYGQLSNQFGVSQGGYGAYGTNPYTGQTTGYGANTSPVTARGMGGVFSVNPYTGGLSRLQTINSMGTQAMLPTGAGYQEALRQAQAQASGWTPGLYARYYGTPAAGSGAMSGAGGLGGSGNAQLEALAAMGQRRLGERAGEENERLAEDYQRRGLTQSGLMSEAQARASRDQGYALADFLAQLYGRGMGGDNATALMAHSLSGLSAQNRPDPRQPSNMDDLMQAFMRQLLQQQAGGDIQGGFSVDRSGLYTDPLVQQMTNNWNNQNGVNQLTSDMWNWLV